METLQNVLEELADRSELIYENPLASPEDVKDFVLEGKARISFENGCLRMENARPAADGQKANYVFWCPEEFPAEVRIEWDFRPVREPGLAMLFFSARGRRGEDLFSPSLPCRTGEYPQYHHGAINAFHVSYFRRKEPDERAFHTCNLRKSYGFYLTAQGADPIPDAEECRDFYRLTLIRKGAAVQFFVNDLPVFRFDDDGKEYGPLLGGGKIGFRQLAPLIAEYRNLKVWSLDSVKKDTVNRVYGQVIGILNERWGNISLAECASLMNYHPSYVWKILSRKGTTYKRLQSEEKMRQAKAMLLKTEYPVAEIARRLGYSNAQNFIRFFSANESLSPGEYRRKHEKEGESSRGKASD